MADAIPSGPNQNQQTDPKKVKPAKENGIFRNDDGNLVKRRTITRTDRDGNKHEMVTEVNVFEGDYDEGDDLS